MKPADCLQRWVEHIHMLLTKPPVIPSSCSFCRWSFRGSLSILAPLYTLSLSRQSLSMVNSRMCMKSLWSCDRKSLMTDQERYVFPEVFALSLQPEIKEVHSHCGSRTALGSWAGDCPIQPHVCTTLYVSHWKVFRLAEHWKANAKETELALHGILCACSTD